MRKTEKLDLYKRHRSEYVTPKEPVFVMIGPAKYLTLTGVGSPQGEYFKDAVSALYTVAYSLKMAEKAAGHDYKVCHLEGQWWIKDGNFETDTQDQWNWRLLMRVPNFVSQNDLFAAITTAIAKKRILLAGDIQLETITEGRCVQVLHTGPYSEEKPTIEKMHRAVSRNGMQMIGPHHEIYLSDPRRVPGERLRTILRYPVE